MSFFQEAQMSYAHVALNDETEKQYARNSFGPLFQGYWKRKTPKSLKKYI